MIGYVPTGYLLMALDLARMDKQWGFSIMVMKWKVFL